MQQQWLWPGVGLCLGLAGIFAGMQKSAADAGAGSLSNEVSAQLAELSSGLERTHRSTVWMPSTSPLSSRAKAAFSNPPRP